MEFNVDEALLKVYCENFAIKVQQFKSTLSPAMWRERMYLQTLRDVRWLSEKARMIVPIKEKTDWEKKFVQKRIEDAYFNGVEA